MQTLVVENTNKIRKHKRDIEKALNVKLSISEDKVEIEGKKDDAYSEFLGQEIVDALQYGFSFENAIKLKNEDIMIGKIDIKKLTRPSRVKTIVGRIIGEKGRTKEIISEMTGCDVAVHDNQVAIIGNTDDVEIATQAIRSLIQGSPHASVYAYLERSRKFRKYKEDDLGLREIKKK
jgi:ribosomal RNA assembly protein